MRKRLAHQILRPNLRSEKMNWIEEPGSGAPVSRPFGTPPLGEDDPDETGIAKDKSAPKAARLVEQAAKPFEADVSHPSGRALAQACHSIDCSADSLYRAH